MENLFKNFEKFFEDYGPDNSIALFVLFGLIVAFVVIVVIVCIFIGIKVLGLLLAIWGVYSVWWFYTKGYLSLEKKER